MIFYIVFFLLIDIFSSLEIKEMDSMYQYSQESIVIIENTSSILNAFRYGLWSKYNPLTNILQVGNVGLFDSDCFLLHSAVEELSQALNLIYYDCINYSSKKIQKNIAFIDNNELQHSFKIDIDPFEYENVWYFFEIVQWPQLERFELMLIYQEEILKENLQIKYPFKDLNLELIFGGGMIVTNSKIITITPGTKFSYFPGKLIKVQYKFEEISLDEDQEWLARTSFESYKYCNCEINNILKLEDIAINWLENIVFTSQKINCNSFQLSGWLKITDIIQNSNEFTYQLITLKSNFQNSLADKNLTPLSLSYKISKSRNQVIITTYSYKFPSVTINFSDDPYLIQKQLDITNKLSLWQKLEIQFLEDQLMINIKFYEGYDIYEYNIQEQVNQFKCTQFKLEYGNTLQSTINYLKILIRNIRFYNCYTINTLQICHHSCQECDGPTQNNCLSCSLESQRIYLPEFKACVCPIYTIDQDICLSYIDSRIQLSNERKRMPKCKYGYFEYEDYCIHCPSIINDQMATCQECLQNPQGWSKDPYCEYDLFLNQNGDVQTMVWQDYKTYYLYDGNNLIYCDQCNQTYSFFVEDQEVQNLEITIRQKRIFCQLLIPYCYECLPSINGFECITCYYQFKLIDGICTQVNTYQDNQFCISPYYITSKRKCNLCPIPNCKYCFEYQQNDLSKCTLYINFEDFDLEQEIKIGCALCQDNFIFDFITGTCQFDTPKIQNCLRSFIYDGQEICTLSQINDFSVAPEIINCQQHLSYCLQCVLTPEFTIKCIICEIGYSASISDGGCYLANKYLSSRAQIIIEGVYQLSDGWVQRIQSFMMKFLPNRYFYFQTKMNQIVDQMIVECQENYGLINPYSCSSYCNSQCLDCKLKDYDTYYCNRCPLNQNYQPIRDQINGTCSECTQLCHACTSRTNDEINNHQPNFIINDNNFKHIKKCLKPVQDPKIYLDPYDQIAKYCFDETCSKIFTYHFIIDYCFWFDISWEQNLNVNYFNSLGIDSLTVHFTFTSLDEQCSIPSFEIKSYLKTKVFSLKYIHFIYSSRKGLIMQISHIIYIDNIDKLEINNTIHKSQKNYQFILQNNQKQIQLCLFNLTITNSQIKNTKSIFQSDIFGDVQMQDVYLLNLNFVNSSLLNLTDYLLQGIVQIDGFIIRNCNFLNSNLFQFINNQLILSVKNLIIEDCEFTNSSIYFIDSNDWQLSRLDLYNIKIKNNKFINSSLLHSKNQVALSLMYFLFESNNLLYSNLIVSNYNLQLSYFKVQNNQIIESQLILILEKNDNQHINVIINQLEASNNQFDNSIFFKLYTTQEFSQVDLSISNLIFNEMTTIINSDQRSYLFQIRCSKLKILNLLSTIFIIMSNYYK
ncbi:unnamed protein product [Paramecium primaurelia]|uniref:Transmembrane protein n=1 Tax=Paramecium primaurelia TaxID=5886 RepID=A0A8S1P4M0_PARPR|nr:unnamed protein product [Paramecium primaurelia]